MNLKDLKTLSGIAIAFLLISLFVFFNSLSNFVCLIMLVQQMTLINY